MSPVEIKLCPTSNLNLNKGDELVTLNSLRSECFSCLSHLSNKHELPKALGHSRYLDQLPKLFYAGVKHDSKRHKGEGKVVIRAALSRKG